MTVLPSDVGRCGCDRVGDLATSLLGCLTGRLNECERPVCRSSLVPGVEAVWDVCCDCCDEDGNPANGQAWVRVVSIFPSDAFPSPLVEPVRCDHGYGVTFELGVVRCVATMGDDGSPPCADDLNRDVAGLLADAHAMREAVDCCFAPTLGFDCGTWVPGSWSPVGPSGGCGGGVLTVDVAFRPARCG